MSSQQAKRLWLNQFVNNYQRITGQIYKVGRHTLNIKYSKDHGTDRNYHFWFRISLDYLDRVDGFILLCGGPEFFYHIPSQKMGELVFEHETTIRQNQAVIHIRSPNLYYPDNKATISIQQFRNNFELSAR